MNDFWTHLKQWTHARIALGRAGNALPTAELLKFRMAHSLARDSVWHEMNVEELKAQLKLLKPPQQVIEVKSQCRNKQEFLLRPELGRKLEQSDLGALEASAASDCVLVLADGLSGKAVEQQGARFAEVFIEQATARGFKIAPLVLARYARVALGDAIGEQLKAKTVVMLIGERPGLASSESLSVYFTFSPQIGKTDAERNCISNIQVNGIAPESAAEMALFLLELALKKQLSGVQLKVEYPEGLEKLMGGTVRK